MIPVGTDAPIYYFPYATIGMIVTNVIFFLAFCAFPDPTKVEYFDGYEKISHEEKEERLRNLSPEKAALYRQILQPDYSKTLRGKLSLQLDRINPLQWVTNNFMHANLGHLVFNMIFLWGFGLVVEGKAGPVLFSIMYLLIGTVYSSGLQICCSMFMDRGTALGASAAIFGLLAVCVVWAPANEFTVFVFKTLLDVPIVIYGFLFFAKEFSFWYLGGCKLDSQLLHIIGFITAAPLGIALLRFKIVDCEGWDIFSYLAGKTGHDSKFVKDPEDANARTAPERVAPSSAFSEKDMAAAAFQHDQVCQAAMAGQYVTAMQLQHQLMRKYPFIKWRHYDLYTIINGFLKAREYDIASGLIEQHITLFSEKQAALSFALCKIKLLSHQRQEARDILNGLNEAFMTDKEREVFQFLLKTTSA